jgi:hypothetical protein
MPSQVLSGNNNPTYTNNTGQNVRLIINVLDNPSSISWGNSGITQYLSGAELTPSPTVTTNPYSMTNGWFTKSGGAESSATSGIRQLVLRVNGNTVYDGSAAVIVSQYAVVNGVAYFPGTYYGSAYGWNSDYCNTFGISIGSVGDIKELMLAPNQSFAAISGPYNILVVKEDGT